VSQLFAAVDLEDDVVGHAQVEDDEPQPEDDMVGEVAEDLHIEEEAEEEAGMGGGGRDAQVPELVHLQARGFWIVVTALLAESGSKIFSSLTARFQNVYL
jgi:hypothetical protein